MPSQTIYDRAYTYSEHNTTTDLDSAKAFEQAAGALKVRVLKGAVGSAQRREDTLVFLAAFNKSADFYHEAGQTRRAITMFERLIDFCTEQGSASAAVQEKEVVEALTKAHRYALKKLIALHAFVGAIDQRRRATVELKELEDSLVASGKAVVPLERETVPPRPEAVPPSAPAAPAHTPAVDGAPMPPASSVQEKPKAPEPAQGVKGAAEIKKKGEAQETAAKHEPASAAAASSEADKAEGLSFADAKVEAAPAPAQPAELPPVPELPAEDGTPATSFKRAVIQAMFYHNFEGVTSLLNNATLFNDSVAREAVWLRLEGLGISLPMVCAGGDQNRLLKQYLGTLTAAQRVQEIVHVRDAQGNNSIMHACALNRARALDELLRQLHDSGVAYTPAPSEGDAASLVDIGLPLPSAKGYNMAIQNQLRTFLREPAKYVASKATLSAGPVVASVPSTMNAAAMTGPTLYGVPLAPSGTGVPAALLAAQAQFAMIAAMFQQAAHMSAMAGLAAGPGPALPQGGHKQAQRGQAQGRGGKAGGKGGIASDAPSKSSWASAAGKGQTAPAAASSPSGAPAASAPAASNEATFMTDAEIAARRAAAAPTAVGGKGKAGAAAAGKKADGGTDAAAAEANAKFGGLSLDEDLVKAAGSTARGARGQGGRGGRTGRRKALFDQFKANEELFGIKATYDETLYTSVLDRSAFTPEEVAAADALARQIDEAESKKAARAGPDDEEGQFSAVAHVGGRHKSGAAGKR